MRPECVENYLIDQNSAGELLFVLPDLGPLPETVWFAQEADDLILIYDDGTRVRLPAIPDTMAKPLKAAKSIAVAETDDEKPLRCYEARRAKK